MSVYVKLETINSSGGSGNSGNENANNRPFPVLTSCAAKQIHEILLYPAYKYRQECQLLQTLACFLGKGLGLELKCIFVMSDCLDAQNSIPVSEDWASDEEDYGCYYGEDDGDADCFAEVLFSILCGLCLLSILLVYRESNCKKCSADFVLQGALFLIK